MADGPRIVNSLLAADNDLAARELCKGQCLREV